jgi:hypothetical protein
MANGRKLDKVLLERALQKVGKSLAGKLPAGKTLDIYIVGGAAGLLRGELGREVSDCDLAKIEPRELHDNLEWAVDAVAAEEQLEANWLNLDSMIYSDYLPAEWKTRAETVGQWGPLRALVLSRGDMIVSKALAARTGGKHAQDLEALAATAEERLIAAEHLKKTAAQTGEDLSVSLAALKAT